MEKSADAGRDDGFAFLYSDEACSSEELCEAMGAALGLERAAPVAVTRRALVDRAFAFRLMNCAGDPGLLKVLFADPRNRDYEGDPEDEASPDPSPGGNPEPRDAEPRDAPSDLALVRQAGQALGKWAAAGFVRVDPEVFETRFGACRACEHLVDPPDRIVYKVRLRRESDPRVCSACGCVAARKASLPTENCPVADSANPAVSLWGEPVRSGG